MTLAHWREFILIKAYLAPPSRVIRQALSSWPSRPRRSSKSDFAGILYKCQEKNIIRDTTAHLKFGMQNTLGQLGHT